MNHKIELSAETLRRLAVSFRSAANILRKLGATASPRTCDEEADEIGAILAARGGAGECCVWHEDESGEYWSGSCGVDWSFIAGGLVENGMRFCPGCGKPVKVADNETGSE